GESASRSVAADEVEEVSQEATEVFLERGSGGAVAGECVGDLPESAEPAASFETAPAGELEDGSEGLVGSGNAAYRSIENQISLDSDTAGLSLAETVSSTVAVEQDDQESISSGIVAETGEEGEELQLEQAQTCFCYPDDSFYGYAEDITVCMVFDSLGMPDSSTAALLDSLSPCWRDYIQYEFKDTVLVIPLADVNDLVLHGGSMPAEMME
ncbi:MAG: hypothetical protein JXR55_11105, partial [Candidatus Fermentibacteraceae bacterium]|nr:hypothetical protein [Candidatus Fermentibacteraceae bacterium]